MKKTLLYCFFAAITTVSGFSQTEKAWKKVQGTGDLVLHKAVKRSTFPEDFKLYQLDLPTVKQALFSVVGNESKKNEGIVIALPNADGNMEHFRMFEASNFDAELQAQYPEIRAFVGNGIEDVYSQICLSIDPNGIQTMVFRTDKRNEFMEKYTADGATYAVYKSGRTKGKLPFTCTTDDQAIASEISDTFNANRNSTATLLTFKLALSCTAEYANFFGATSAAQFNLVLAGYNATMTRVNGVYRKDFAIQMNIVAQSSNVTYYNPTTDPYSDAAVGTLPANVNNTNGWNVQLQNTLSSSLTGTATTLAANNAAYDVGHLFGGDGGGGNAGCIGCVCTNDTATTTDKNKGSGYTSPGDAIPQGDTFDIDYVAHELGHQFGGNHTFTHSTEDNAANYEPGSGSTIMAYAGITARDVQSNSDDYFHAISIAQIQANMASKTCQTSTPITHGTPVVVAGTNYTIPLSTPFALTGSATDSGGGALTYCWEQYDEAIGAANLCGDTNTLGDTDCVPVGTKTSGPVFRSYDPTSSPTRYFPRMESVLTGSTTTAGAEIAVEALSSVARTLNFRLTVRDNVAAGGQTNFGNMVVTVANIAALNVTSQNTDGVVYPVASTQTVTWTSAGNSTITGGANVDILFSSDNGVTWTTLLAATPNDGSQAVTLPTGLSAAYCRFMVKANANIFFNVNTKSFAIGNYVYQSQTICTDYVRDFGSLAIPENSASFAGYAINIPDTFTLVDTNVKVELTHNDIGSVFLGISPAHIGTAAVTQFFNGSCDGSANMNLNFETTGAALNCAATTTGATTLFPVAAAVTAVNGYNGNAAGGNWYFWMTDIATTDGITGTLQKVTLNLCKTVLVPVLANESFGLTNFSLYPNPNNGNFTINFNSNSNNDISVNAHDIRGRQVYTKSFKNNSIFNEEIQLNNVEAGIYIITIQDGDKKEVKKIIVE